MQYPGGLTGHLHLPSLPCMCLDVLVELFVTSTPAVPVVQSTYSNVKAMYAQSQTHVVIWAAAQTRVHDRLSTVTQKERE